jgi:hypothetical protein
MNVEAMKQHAAGRWPEILATVGGASAEILDGKHHPCSKLIGALVAARRVGDSSREREIRRCLEERDVHLAFGNELLQGGGSYE